MISLQESGNYTIAETRSHTRILVLNEKMYVWLLLPNIGDVLSYTKADHKIFNVLSTGEYRLYDVDDEPEFVDLQHLELRVGHDKWQGYLLLTGLPNADKKRSRIIVTGEQITGRSAKQMQANADDHVEHICIPRKEVI